MIKIYNLPGEEIKTLVNKYKKARTYTMQRRIKILYFHFFPVFPSPCLQVYSLFFNKIDYYNNYAATLGINCSRIELT